MHEAGLSYGQACRAYRSLVSIVEDGLWNGRKIGFGKVGCLYAVRKPARDVTMGFIRTPNNKVVRARRVFHIDERLEYKFKLFRAYTRNHHMP
jgi:hypothetical protein